MDIKGRLAGVSRNWLTGKWQLTFETDQDITGGVDGLKDRDLSITAKRYRQKRSLDANAYYWQLLSKLAEAVHISKNRAHNLMLGRYGQPEIMDGHLVYVVVPDTPDGAERAMEADTYHIKPTSEVRVGDDCMLFRTYRMMRGSSTYDTKEMSELINGLVAECKNVGIETATPAQLEEMMRLYEQNWRRRHE